MTIADGLILILPAREDAPVAWKRVIDGAIVQQGTGEHWLSACGLSALPAGMRVMLVPPAHLTALHWIAYPDMPARQGRAAARLAVLESSIGPADSLFAAADENDDPARPHLIALAARTDVQHWLLWAQYHGVDPDEIVPAPLLLPVQDSGYARAEIGGAPVLRGADCAPGSDDDVAQAIIGDAPVFSIEPDWTGGLTDPPLTLRQGDFAKRVRRSIDAQSTARMAIWCGVIALISLLIALISIAKYQAEASRLDAESLALARKILPAANDATLVEADLDARLAARGAAAYTFGGPAAGLFTAMQSAPGVSLSSLSRSADGTLQAQLAAARAEDINMVLLALKAAGFTITATSSRDPSGRALADITVRS